tara:strand:+ start:224 stop:994 length:771 start_codon:yes stop_codon:yes gene_type:complete
MSSYDVVGNIAILKFPSGVKKSEKVRVAKQLMAERKSVRTVVEKSDRVKGRLRTMRTLHLAGERNLEALYLENGCRFRLNIESCYFSPRLSNERKEIFSKVKRGERVLVMFAGVGPFSISIAKNSKASEVYSVELGRECSKYAKENVKLNKLSNVSVIQGDVKRIIPQLHDSKIKFDRIVMARPNLKNTFLKEAFSVISKNGVIHYYGFSKDKTFVVDTIKERAEDCNKKIRILKVKRAGDIAPYKFRWRVDMVVR